MTAAILLFILVMLIYILLVDIFTVFFRITGMTEEKARFQVISLLTNAGYTTKEAESVTNVKLRRDLAKATMIFGYAFSATIISSIVTVFMSIAGKQTEVTRHSLLAIVICSSVFFLFLVVRKVNFIKIIFDRFIENLAIHLFYNSGENHIIEVERFGPIITANVLLNIVPENLVGKQLKDTNIKSEYEVNILLIKDEDGNTFYPKMDTILQENTTLMLMGTLKNIKKIFS